MGLPDALLLKNPPANAGAAGERGLILGLGRFPRGGHGNPHQYSCLKNQWTEELGRLQSIRSQKVRPG